MLSTRQAAQILGVHDSSVKRWCTEGVLPCSYTSGGHRRISLDQLLNFARQQKLPCILLSLHPFEQIVWQGVEQVRRSGDYAVLVDQVYDWAISGVVDLLGPLLELLTEINQSFASISDQLMAPVMYRVGQAWVEGQIDIGDEHRITEMVMEVLYEKRSSQERAHMEACNRFTHTAIVGCIEGNQHALGAMILRFVLEENGWHVVYLGGNVPSDEFGIQRVKHEASLICVSMTPPHGTAEARRLLFTLARMYNPDQPYRCAIGGQEIDDSFESSLNSLPFLDTAVFQNTRSFVEWL